MSRRPSRLVLRPPRAGDLGWVVHRHGVLYAREYGWDERFEGLVAEIVANFVARFDARRERCWIAQQDGVPVGSVFVVRAAARTAQLRLLLIEPQVRGRGLGKRLVQACIRFARARGYGKLVLLTQSELSAARSIYAAAGFERKKTQRHAKFGIRMTGEYWELRL